MQEVVYFPIHGNSRGGTGYTCYGGFGYGKAEPDPVTLKPDRPTDLFAPSLTTDVEDAARSASGDKWIAQTPIEKSVHAQRVKRAPVQPATVALTKTGHAAKGAAKAAAAKDRSLAKTRAQVARVQRAIEAGRLNPVEAKKRAERVAAHGYHMELAANDAYNAIAIMEAKIRAREAAGAPGKSVAAHKRVLVKMRAMADRLHQIAARDRALAASVRDATMPLGVSDYVQMEGYGQEPTGDARDAEAAAVQQIAQASSELAADNVGAAEVTIANAEGSFQAANQRMSAEQAAGDVFADVSKALEPNAVPWGKIGVAILVIAALRQATR